MLNPIQPITVCNICEDENNKIVAHNCNICSIDSWVICQECHQKLKNEPCPMCRTITIDVNDNTGSIVITNRSTIINTGSTVINTVYPRFVKNILECGYNLLTITSIFIFMVYLGKCYYWLYCTGTCDPMKEDVEDCLCYTKAKRDGYWKDFRYSLIEALGATVLSAILYSCCCIRNSGG